MKVPGPEASPVKGPDQPQTLWVLVLSMSLIWGTVLIGVRPLGDPDEGRYAQAAREMLSRGDWMVPTLNTRPHLTKPPGTYWATMTGFRLFGFNEWGARLPVGLAFGAWMTAAFFLGRRWGGDQAAGVWSSCILGTSLLPFVGGSLLTADPFLAAAEGGALTAAAVALENPRRRRIGLAGMGFFLGLAFFIKGPPGWLPLAGLVAAWSSRREPRRSDFWGLGLAFFLAVGLGGWWFLAMVLQEPSRWGFFLGGEVIGRIFDPDMRRNEPLWLPCGVFLAGTLPWNLGLVWPLPGLRRAWQRPVGRLLIGWVLFGMVVFTASRSKMPLYVLPLTLAPVVAAGSRWSRWVKSGGWAKSSALVLVFVSAGLLLILRVQADQWTGYRHSRVLAQALEKNTSPGQPVFVLQSRFEPGLAFYLNRPLVSVAVAPGDRFLPHDLTLEELGKKSQAGPVIVTGRSAALARKPADWFEERIFEDQASRFCGARWSASPADKSGFPR